MVVHYIQYMDGVVEEIQGRAVDGGVPLIRKGNEWKLPVLLFADHTVLMSDSEWELQDLVNMLGTVCAKRNLKVNTGKTKVMVFERGAATECEVRLNGQAMENVSSFKRGHWLFISPSLACIHSAPFSLLF